MIGGIDMSFAINSTLTIIIKQLKFPIILIIVYTDSYSLYEYLVKLGTIKEKCLIIDIMAIRKLLEYALSLARDLAHSWPSWPPSILSVCNSSIRL
jgi:hypothetical protein